MKPILSIFMFLAISFSSAVACANYYYTLDKEGNLVPLGYNWHYPFNKNFNPELNEKKLLKLEKKLRKEKTFMLLSDYSVCLMKLGKSREALDILTNLYSHYPKEYKIASNLGTAYELNGMADSALKYIRRGMELNPHDHEGSEWVHEKILETKLAMMKDPGFLKDRSVLQLTESQKKDTMVLYHISIQLQERVPFIPVKDAIMASLFTDLGDISANLKSVEYARAYYQIAKEYYGGSSTELDNKIKEMAKLMNKYVNTKPVDDHLVEGQKIKLGYFKYTELLTDNDPGHYKVNWSKINTNVDSLLTLVDLTLTVQQVKDSSVNTPEKKNDELKLVREHVDSIPVIAADTTLILNLVSTDKEVSDGNHTWIYIICSALLVLGLGFIFIKKIK